MEPLAGRQSPLCPRIYTFPREASFHMSLGLSTLRRFNPNLCVWFFDSKALRRGDGTASTLTLFKMKWFQMSLKFSPQSKVQPKPVSSFLIMELVFVLCFKLKKNFFIFKFFFCFNFFCFYI